MKFCSECGLAIAPRWICQDKRERYFCPSCGTTHYQNPRIIVSCVVCWGDKVLLCRRSQDPARGQWNVPAGFLECGETLEEGAARETLEETGVIVDPRNLELHSVMNMTALEQVTIQFRVALTSKPEVRCGPECLDVAFMSQDEIPFDQVAWRASMGDRPQRFFDEMRSGRFSIQLISIASAEGHGFRSREYTIRSVNTSDGGLDAQGGDK